MSEIVLTVAGQRLTGWETVEVSRSIEAVSGSFSLSVSNRDAWPIPEGSAVQLTVDSEPLVSGWLDVVRPAFAPRSRTVQVSGRDRTADLVDCVPVDMAAEFEGLALDGLAAELAHPFGIQVVIAGDPGAVFPRFAIQPGETAFEALDRAARLRGVLLTTDGLGRLVLERPASARATVSLREGENVLSGSGNFDRSARFRRYVVRGQLIGSDLLYADDLNAEAEAFDDAVRGNRTTLILAEAAADFTTAQVRAQWEASVRRARGSAIQLTVQGWRQGPTGNLWRPNLLARATCASLRTDRELLVSSVRFRLDPQSGTTTELELVHPDAFQPKPVLDLGDDLAADLADPEDF